MTLTRLTKYAMMGAVALTFGLSNPANAQTTETVTASMTVENGFTVSEDAPLSFGTIGFFLDGTNDLTMTLSTAAAESFVAAGGTSNGVEIVAGTAADIVIQGPIAADIDMVITSADVVNPTDGTTAFTLNNFTYDDQSGNTGSAAFDTPVTIELTAPNADENILIGADLVADGSLDYEDGLYTGEFAVTFQY